MRNLILEYHFWFFHLFDCDNLISFPVSANANFTECTSTDNLLWCIVSDRYLCSLQPEVFWFFVQNLLLDQFFFLFRQSHIFHLLIQFIPSFFPFTLFIFRLGVFVLNICFCTCSLLLSLCIDLDVWGSGCFFSAGIWTCCVDDTAADCCIILSTRSILLIIPRCSCRGMLAGRIVSTCHNSIIRRIRPRRSFLTIGPIFISLYPLHSPSRTGFKFGVGSHVLLFYGIVHDIWLMTFWVNICIIACYGRRLSLRTH